MAISQPSRDDGFDLAFCVIVLTAWFAAIRLGQLLPHSAYPDPPTVRLSDLVPSTVDAADKGTGDLGAIEDEFIPGEDADSVRQCVHGCSIVSVEGNDKSAETSHCYGAGHRYSPASHSLQNY